ncbi:UNVERIFIED_ORG: hypothetical protein ABIB52_004291 [Arthrobacter sp. UYCu721]
MNVKAESQVTACGELEPGENIEAQFKGHCYVRGEVTEIMPEQGLFWIREESLGDRLLLDMRDMEIFRIGVAQHLP